MASFQISKPIDAPAKDAWHLLSAFGDIARWNTGLIDSYITKGPQNGPGATRRCDLPNGKRIEERITAWQAGEGFDMTYEHIPAPFDAAWATFRITPTDDGSCHIVMTFGFTPRGLWKVETPLFSLVLKRGLRKVLSDFKRQVEYDVRRAARQPRMEVRA